MTRWVVAHCGPDVPMHFSAFHPDWKMRDVPPTPPATLTRAREIALANGRALRLHRQRARRGRATPPAARRAASAVIERDWYEIRAYRLDDRRALRRPADPHRRGVFDGPAGIVGSAAAAGSAG